VPTKNLGSFLQNSKAEGAHAAAAWSAETGKGLFYYAKNEKDKEHPTGVIALVRVLAEYSLEFLITLWADTI